MDIDVDIDIDLGIDMYLYILIYIYIYIYSCYLVYIKGLQSLPRALQFCHMRMHFVRMFSVHSFEATILRVGSIRISCGFQKKSPCVDEPLAS